MATELVTISAVNNKPVSLVQFSGGIRRGCCVQLTQGLQSVQMTKEQALALSQELATWATQR